ncbi:MAG: hypothetical protein MJZ34_07305 [Paludibacteraceae bacterium]|nr:hypothetical protein [Paludibacteraceae bacterium]
MNETTRQLYAAANAGHGNELLNSALGIYALSGLGCLLIIICILIALFALKYLIFDVIFNMFDDEDEDD